MSDREAREHAAASVEARHAVPTFEPSPVEDVRQDMMVRYLQAMASHSAAALETPVAAGTHAAETRHVHHKAHTTAELRVRDVMRRSVAGVSRDAPFLDVARMLARRQTGAVPVVDEAQRVIGVIAESDLLARAASITAGDHPGAFARMLRRHPRDAGAGVTAGMLMSAPALTVHSWTLVIDAARIASRSRIRQVFVTDHKGHLVGVVSRSELLHALVRDDAAIRAEVLHRVVVGELGIDPAQVDAEVHDGTVTLSGSLDAGRIPKLVAEVEQIADVVAVVDHLVPG
ncbi:CBS domain-containing protein [Streptomyces sp. NPDC002766]|jgi:CBS domain-containing protein|uniref:CBS domain-containing protein n=1 Tax=unclassified Streptomyces TaxID=2593676 RepID=UPI003317B8C7